MKRALYVGLDAPKVDDKEVIHIPLIQTLPIANCNFDKLHDATHIIVTSKTTCHYAKECFQKSASTFISVGSATTKALAALGINNVHTALHECQEGIIELIDGLALDNPLFFWPHSSLSRPLLKDYFEVKGYSYVDMVLYDTVYVAPKEAVDLESFDEIHFSSPSCVDAFFQFFKALPNNAAIFTKGHVTKAALEQKRTKDKGLKGQQ